MKKALFVNIFLLICLILSATADFKVKALRPTLENFLKGELISSSMSEPAATQKLLKKAAFLASEVTRLSSKDQFKMNNILAANFADRTVPSQVIKQILITLGDLEKTLQSLNQIESLNNSYIFADQSITFVQRSLLMEKQVNSLKLWLIEFRLFAGSLESREAKETVNQLYLSRKDSDKDGFESWEDCWTSYAKVFDSLKTSLVPESE